MITDRIKQQYEFSPAVIEKLGYYVYLLKDPQTHKVFYVGKGTGNRIFQHLKEAMISSNSYEKLDTIRAIMQKGLPVICLIHRHGLTEKEAFEVEASLIDFIGLEDLSNRVAGQKSDERGQMNVEEVIARYDAPKVIITEPAILIIINRRYYRGISQEELYESTRQSWVIGKRRNKARYAFSIYNGIIRQVYEIEKWYCAENNVKRWMFDGKIAASLQHYVGGDVSHYLTPGAQNPIKYVNC